MKIFDIKTEILDKTQFKLLVTTDQGELACIYHFGGKPLGVVWLCGALGGLDGPSFGIFKILGEELVRNGISSLRVDYRKPGNFKECVADVLLAIALLGQNSVNQVILVGHSFGGAVAIEAGTLSSSVKAVVALSSQTYGAQNVANLSPRSLLLIHGERDRNLPARCSQFIYQKAREPKELYILPNNGHFLREAHNELIYHIKKWIIDKFATC